MHDAELRDLVQELRGAVAQALGDSEELGDILRRIRERGFSLYLVVDRKGHRELLPAVDASAVGDDSEVLFRIDGNDLSFLRSIGIDPTRRLRRRRPSS